MQIIVLFKESSWASSTILNNTTLFPWSRYADTSIKGAPPQALSGGYLAESSSDLEGVFIIYKRFHNHSGTANGFYVNCSKKTQPGRITSNMEYLKLFAEHLILLLRCL